MTKALILSALVLFSAPGLAAAQVEVSASVSLSVDIDPPIEPPAPVAIEAAPPPMLVDPPPPAPSEESTWIGGYWHWDGRWVWARGRWVSPPRPSYIWAAPYYENRRGVVIYVGGHWGPPGYRFVPPPPAVQIAVSPPRPGVVLGPRPVGPVGVFVPPPPGSRPGLIVPAPIGTAPAVVVSAPPVVRPGMVVRPPPPGAHQVTVYAPAGVTRVGRPVQVGVPMQAHLAAARPAVFHAPAPHLVGHPSPGVGPHPVAVAPGPHPGPMHPAPMHPTPMHPAPMHPAPMHATPMHAAPMHAAPMHAAPMHAAPMHPAPAPMHAAPMRPAPAPMHGGGGGPHHR